MSSLIRTIIALVVGLGLAFGAYFLGVASVERSQQEVPTQNVYVFSQAVDSGVRFSDLVDRGALTIAAYPVSALPADAVTPGSEPEGDFVLSVSQQAGQILTSLTFVAEDVLVEQTGVLPSDFLVSVALTIDQTVAGLLKPGDRVAVYATGSVPGETTPIDATVTVIPEARVVLVGRANQADADAATIYITLALSATEAQKLVHYVNTSSVHLGLIGSKANGQALAPIIGFGAEG